MQIDFPRVPEITRGGRVGSTLVALSAGWLLLAGGVEARTWSDATGRYSVEADFVTANEKYVVLKNDANELMMAPRAQLASEDQEYIQQQLTQRREQARTTAEDEASSQPPSSDGAGSEPAATRVAAEPGSQASRNAEFDSTWRIKGDAALRGRLIGFGVQPLSVVLRDNAVFVNDRPIEELPTAYQEIIPYAASQSTGESIDRFEQILDRLSVPKRELNVVVEGVQLRLVSGEVITVPPALLTEEDAKLVTPSFNRWKSAQHSSVPEDVRAEVDRRERLVMDSYTPYRGGAAEPPRKLTMFEMQLEAVDAGVTDMWEVALYPPDGHDYPRTVIVTGENSRVARLRAKREFPDWRVGPVRKRSY